MTASVGSGRGIARVDVGVVAGAVGIAGSVLRVEEGEGGADEGVGVSRGGDDAEEDCVAAGTSGSVPWVREVVGCSGTGS
jgi:hypothetical protein